MDDRFPSQPSWKLVTPPPEIVSAMSSTLSRKLLPLAALTTPHGPYGTQFALTSVRTLTLPQSTTQSLSYKFFAVIPHRCLGSQRVSGSRLHSGRSRSCCGPSILCTGTARSMFAPLRKARPASHQTAFSLQETRPTAKQSEANSLPNHSSSSHPMPPGKHTGIQHHR
jgi:hypothetical protein